MLIATQANYRTTYSAKLSLSLAFRTAYRAGCAMGFALVSLGLLGIYLSYLVLIILIVIFKEHMGLKDSSVSGTDSGYFKPLF